MVTFELTQTAVLTDEEKRMLEKAKKMPVVFDDDSPQLTDDMERAFAEARKAHPYQGEKVTLYVTPSTLEKAKRLGADYIPILSRLLDKAVEEYRVGS